MKRGVVNALTAAAAVLLAGCVSPGVFDQKAVNRYQEAMATRGYQPRMGEEGIDSLRPAPGATGPALKIVRDEKTGQYAIPLTLDEAIMRALANNLDIRVVSFDPSVSREEVTKAAAAFDYVFFARYNFLRSDLEQAAPASSIIVTPQPNTVSVPTRTALYEVGLKETTITGAQWSVTGDLTRVIDDTGTTLLRNSWEPTVTMQLLQPLLRNAWPEFNLAQLKITQLNYQISVEQFRQKVEETISAVISTYWRLIQARNGLEIQQRLLDETITTMKRIVDRIPLDATDVEVKQAEAAVAVREASLIQARKTILDVQDQLARLLADAQINVLGNYEIIPTTPLNGLQVQIDGTDQLITALRHNPQLEQARLAIAGADVNVKVSQNQTLPRLDFGASAEWQGLGGNIHEAFDSFITADFFSYSLGAQFEYPIGNRSAIADLKEKRFQRTKAIAILQNLADQVAVALNERIRQIHTTWSQRQAQEKAVAASRIQLDALIATEEIRGRLTPEFLLVKLNAQETLANAELAALQALVDYNVAMSDLALVSGTVLELHGVKLALPVVLGEEPWPEGKRGASQSVSPSRANILEKTRNPK